MKTITCKLRTDEKASAILADTMRLFNQVCNHLSGVAWDGKVFRQFDLHASAYHAVRQRFPALPSQLVVRAIRVVADSYKIDRSVKHTFGERSAVVFDARCFKLKGVSSATLTTPHGRITLSLAHGGKQRADLEIGKVGEADLLFRDGVYYLALSVTLTDTLIKETIGVLGVDLGITEIATDSEGNQYSGETVKAIRRRYRRIRTMLQSKGTKSAKRHLRKIRNKQKHFVSTVNHTIAKAIVQTANLSAKALALETLTGIRERGNGFNRNMRWLLGGWAFHDLQSKIAYKARESGLSVCFVPAAYTSQTCFVCGHCERANRKSQSHFECVQCGFCDNADRNAAKNIGVRGLLSLALLQSTTVS